MEENAAARSKTDKVSEPRRKRHINERTDRKKVIEYTRNSTHIHHVGDNKGGKKKRNTAY